MFSQSSYIKMNEANDGDKGGGAGEDKSSAQIELLTKSVGLLAEGLKNMEGNQTSIVETLAKITNQSKESTKEQIEQKFGEGVDFEQLTRKDFAALIMESTKQALRTEMEKLTSGVDTKVKDLAERFESKTASEQIANAADKNPDFWEWSDEIKQLLKDNPTLTVSRAYSLAKSENSKKAEELVKKYAPAKKESGNSFIGLTPTSSISTRDSTHKMSQAEAAEKAFQTVMGSLGDRIQNGDLRIA